MDKKNTNKLTGGIMYIRIGNEYGRACNACVHARTCVCVVSHHSGSFGIEEHQYTHACAQTYTYIHI